MRKLELVVAATLAAMVAFGKSTVLTSGDVWSTATWDNGVPVAGDDVTVSSDSTYDLDIGALNSLTFAGTTGATLSAAEGKTLSLAGEPEPQVGSDGRRRRHTARSRRWTGGHREMTILSVLNI